MLTGNIQAFRPDKNFGFIRPDESGPDVFFHRSALQADFAAVFEGQQVTYELDEQAERPRAVRVMLRDEGRANGPMGPGTRRAIQTLA